MFTSFDCRSSRPRAERTRTLRLAVVACLAAGLVQASAMGQSGFKYFYDDSGRLTRAIDTSGNEIDYTYDAAGNLTQVSRVAAQPANALAILNFTPQAGGAGAVVTLEGQNFGVTPAANAVSFNGAAATVLTASASTLTVSVPNAATTGPISITVSGKTAASSTNFTVVPGPRVLSVSPHTVLNGTTVTSVSSFTVSGANLTGATFTFIPGFSPAPVSVTSANISPDGSSAVLSLSIAANTIGSYSLVATTQGGTSSQIPSSANTISVLSPDGDADGDGLTNAVELALGTDPLNPTTSGDGLPDGWQVFFGLDPLDASLAGKDLDNSGLSILQDFQQGLSPVNPNLVPPAVSQVTPANNATDVNINGVVVLRFAEPLLTGTTLAAAQTAITTALGQGTQVPPASQQLASTTLQSYMNRSCCGNSVVAGTVTLTGPDGAVQGNVTPSNDGLSVTFATSQPLASNTSFTVQVNGLRDAAGNLMTVPFTSTYTTGSAIEFSLPAVTLVAPENNSSKAPLNTHYTVQFSKVIDPATLTPANFVLTNYSTGKSVPGVVQADADGVTASFVPANLLSVATTYYVTLNSGIKDLYGNSLAGPINYYFTTGESADTAPLHVTAVSPANGGTNVGTNAVMGLLFNQAINLATEVPNIHVTAGGQPVAVMMALSSGDQRVTLTPAAALQPNTQYTVTYDAGLQDLAGLALDNPGSFSFTTAAAADGSNPAVVAYDPLSSATGVPLNTLIHVVFNKPMDATSMIATNIQLYPNQSAGSYPIAGTASLSSDGMTLTFAPTAALAPETQYTFSAYPLLDYEGRATSSQFSFVTGTASASAGPQVISMSPPNGSTGVPLNADIFLSLNEPISVASAGPTAIAVSASGTPVPGSIAVSSDSMGLTFKPTTNLAASTAYTVSASGFTDLAGNAVTPFTGTITTGTTSIAPGQVQITGFMPASGSTNVPVNSTISVTFSNPVNPLTINPQSFQVDATVAGLGAVEIAGTYSFSGSTVTFTPLTQLPGNATISLAVSYYASVQDIAGNISAYGFANFTTASTADTTAPQVVSITPANGATGIGLTGQVAIVFSKSMNPNLLNVNTVALLANGQQQYFTARMSADNRTLLLSNLNLPASRLITVAIPHTATDLSGNALADFTSTFTTGPAYSSTAGNVSNQRPANGATNVPISTSPIVLFANKPLSLSAITNALHISQNGQLVSGTVSLVDNGETIEFTPSAPWQNGAVVQILLDTTAQAADGSPVTQYQGSFSTLADPSTISPAPVSVSPASGAQNVPLNAIIDIAYNAPLAAASVNSTNAFLNGSSVTVAGTLSLDASGTRITFKPNAALAANTQYCFSAYYLTGTNGQPAVNILLCFQTGTASLTKAPTVIAVSPPDTITSVPVNANISVEFSAAIDPVSVTGTTIKVTGGGQTVIPVSASFSNSNQTVSITPESPLPPSTAMTIAVSGVTDVAGNAVTPLTTHFTTGTTPTTASPVAIQFDPPTNASGVPLNAALSIKASAPLDPTTVNAGTYSLYDQTLSKYLSSTLTQSADWTTVYLLPAAPLSVERGYQIVLGYPVCCITDLAGNPLQSSSPFTTGTTASTSAPQVTGISPPNAATGIALNAQIQVQFNEPVDATKLGAITLSANGAAQPIAPILSNGNQTLVVTSLKGLAPSTTFTLKITGVTDLSGNAMTAPVTSTFTTGTEADLTKPSIVTFEPKSGSTGVPLNAWLRIQFNKAFIPSTLGPGSVQLYPSQLSYTSGIPGTIVLSPDSTSLIFKPAAQLAEDSQYCVTVTGVEDLEGDLLQQYSVCFTTGESVSTAPQVTAMSPLSGATGVPLNPLVSLELNEPMSVLSAGASAVTLKSGGIAVPGSTTVSSDSMTLAFTPTGNLAASTTYTVSASGFTDLAGNTVTPFSGTFTTGTAAVPPGQTNVTSITPANNATNVAVTSQIVVTFSNPVNELSVTPVSIDVTANQAGKNAATVAGTYSFNGTTVTFTPLTPLPGSATVTVAVSYYASVQDLAGNASAFAFSTFTTAATADTTPPTVVSITPSNGATGIGLMGQITIVFSKSMNPSTLTNNNIALLAGDQQQSYSVRFSSDNRTMVLNGLNLPASTLITVGIPQAATDLSGNGLVDFTSTFTTGQGFNNTSGRVSNQRPANGATNVATTASPIVLFVNKPLIASSLTAAFHISQNGQEASGTVQLVDNGQTIVFTPSSAWQYGALIQVFLDATAEATDGSRMSAYQGQFTIVSDPATAAPAAVSVSPASGAQNVPLNANIDIGFSLPIDATTVIASNVFLNGPSGGAAVTLSQDQTGTRVMMTPNAALVASSQYCAYAVNLQGTNGRAANGVAYCFQTGTTGAISAPAILAVSPPDNAMNVPVNANISVEFAGPVDPISVNGTTVQVTGGAQTVIPISYSFTNGNQVATITPEAPLPSSTLMTLTINGIVDVAGNTVSAQTTHFTTGTAPVTSAPVLLGLNPPQSATGVPVNAAVSFQASEPLDPTSLNPRTFALYQNTGNQSVANTISQSSDGTFGYLLPSAALATQQLYLIYISYPNCCITDLAGNSLPTAIYGFTTGTNASATAPQVSAVSPSSGLTGVPINAQVMVQFNEPVDVDSLGGITLAANSTPVAASLTLSNGNQTLVIKPAQPLAINTTYTLSVSGVSDISGSTSSSLFTSSFTTSAEASVAGPTVTNITPANGATGVLTTTTVQIQFSTSMNQISLTPQSIALTVNGGAAVPGTVTVNPAGTIVTYTPANALAASTTYIITIGYSPIDLTGRSPSFLQYSFTTGTQ